MKLKTILLVLAILALAPNARAQSISGINPIAAGPASLSAADAGTCTVTNTGCLIVNIGGYAGIGVQVTGSWTGTVTFEVTIDGTNWVSEDLVQTTSTTPVATTTGNGVFVGATVGSKFRVRFSTRSSGTAVASIRVTMNVASSGFGTGVNGTSGAPVGATYLTQTSDGGLTQEQALSSLATGLMKVTTATGVVSSVAAPSGAVVGTTDVQALSGKTGNISQWTNDSSYGVVLSGNTASLGGGALLAGVCASGTASVTGAATTMAAVASPVTYPGDGSTWLAYISAADTVTVKVCAIVGLTPTASVYRVRVIQ